MKIYLTALLLSAIAICTSSAAFAQTILKTEAYPGSTLTDETQSSFRKFFVATGPLNQKVRKADRKYARTPYQSFEGTTKTITYRIPDIKVSSLDVFRNYTSAFDKNGFNTIFTCSDDVECGEYFVKHVYGSAIDPNRPLSALSSGVGTNTVKSPAYRYHYWTGEKTIENEQHVFSLLVAKYGNQKRPALVVLDQGKVVSLETDKISLTTEAIENGLEENGFITLDGIYFDFDKDTIKPVSRPALDTIAAFIKEQIQMKTGRSFYIVGHTDNVGDFEYNMDLSLRRAKKVDATLMLHGGYLTTKTTKPYGVGPLSPVAPNDTEEGRALNRRVVLVEKD